MIEADFLPSPAEEAKVKSNRLPSKKTERRNSRRKINGGQFQLLGRRQTRLKNGQGILSRKSGGKFRRDGRQHDPMLVLNMSIFNFADGWNRVFNPIKAHENGPK